MIAIVKLPVEPPPAHDQVPIPMPKLKPKPKPISNWIPINIHTQWYSIHPAGEQLEPQSLQLRSQKDRQRPLPQLWPTTPPYISRQTTPEVLHTDCSSTSDTHCRLGGFVYWLDDKTGLERERRSVELQRLSQFTDRFHICIASGV
ncbi:GL24260 [Drosophila persimilis]|uniref:GL24260 n=1 Tax=Drosophila persimilis TaxID=7234 RepID=B4G4Y6_DROPE|nr:GL24260 [Drosophila persimilis]